MTVTARARARVSVGVLLLVCVLAQLVAVAPSAAAATAEPRHRTGGEVTAEARLFDQHNAARTDPAAFGQPGAAPVAPLRWAEDLATVARAWADTMAATGDFVGNPAVASEVCCALAVTQNVASVEGIGLYYTIEGAADRVVELLMASPAHRSRLRSATTPQVGIGASLDAAGRLWVSIVHRDPDRDAPPGETAYPPPPTPPGPTPTPTTSPTTPPTTPPTSSPSPSPSPTVPGTTPGGSRPGGPVIGGPGGGGVSPTPRDVSVACPSEVPRAPFTDVHWAEARTAVDCLVWWGIASGTSPTTFSPARPVRRDQMASFLARAIEASGGSLPGDPRHRFPDVAGDSVHATAINQLADAGIVMGRTDGTFAPGASVSRGQVTQMLVRSFEYRAGQPLPPPTRRWFTDVGGTTFERPIFQSADAGWTAGYADGTYRPAVAVRRDQMAVLLTRWLTHLVADGHATPPRR